MNRGIAVILVLALHTVGAGCLDCDQIQEDATALRAEAEACSEGDTCVVVSLYELTGDSNCLGAFQCHAAFRSDVDLEQLSTQATELADEFGGCNMCVMAGCMNMENASATCNAQSGKCEIVGE